MTGEPAEAMMAFSASVAFDQRLAPDDLSGSAAHVGGLERAGILDPDEALAIKEALRTVRSEIEDASFVFQPGDEDIHTAIERRVIELIGPTGEKLHTGRSRHDQVATALRLYARRHAVSVAEGLVGLQATLLRRAEQAGDTFLPGYTHLQHAQPVLHAHLLLAHGWALARDVDRICDTTRRCDVSPLGAGALAGSSLALDPDGVAKDLKFASRFENSLDAVSDRDFVAEFLFDLALIGVHLSRLGEEIVIYSSEEFGFYGLDDAWATGSSMLPQKKNPDIAELARGKAGRLIGHVTGFLATLKGLPLSYNRDLQEDKEPLFDAFDQVILALRAMDGLMDSMTFDAKRMEQAASAPELRAVDLAEWLVGKGVAFREAHGIVAGLVRKASAENVPLGDLVRAHPNLGDEPASRLEQRGLPRSITAGGTGREAVSVQLGRFLAHLSDERARIATLLG
jgi:argininosuccinate lyase